MTNTYVHNSCTYVIHDVHISSRLDVDFCKAGKACRANSLAK
jgi:hypothetical protein